MTNHLEVGAGVILSRMAWYVRLVRVLEMSVSSVARIFNSMVRQLPSLPSLMGSFFTQEGNEDTQKESQASEFNMSQVERNAMNFFS